jgi:transcriptional regulator with XRE-family HTH domain
MTRKIDAESLRLRKEAGEYIKYRREQLRLSQMDLSKRLGLEYYTFVSGVETGASRVPPDKLRDWAAALEVDLKALTKTLLRFYDPFTFEALFGPEKSSARGGE